MKINKLCVWIIIYALIAVWLLFVIENIYQPVYLAQMLQKIFLFAIIPLAISWHYKMTTPSVWKISKRAFVYGGCFGLLWALVIFITYFLLKDVISWDAIRVSLEVRSITASSFVWVFVYIMFGNSLLEEFFFRWIVFNETKKISKIFAYGFSSVLFALYHIVIFGTWFSWYLIVLALVWLLLWSLFFAWLYEKTGGIWWAWVFHIIADLAILIIWYIMLFS